MILFAVVGCGPEEKTKLRVFIAGSLMIPFDELEQAYEALHPEVDVEVEAHGSIQVIRHVTEIHDLIDVVVPADYSLIPMLMYSGTVPESGQSYAEWYVKFATNRLALAYTPQSLYADEIDGENWYEIISRPDVRLGLSDPRFDASGYRSLMVVQLAEALYKKPTIFEEVYLGRFVEPITVQKDAGGYIIRVPELLEPNETSNIVMRGSSIALIALLESGDVDYAFEYKSVIQQHGLEYVSLPGEINLGDDLYADDYAGAKVRLDFQRFSTVKPEFAGEVIAYGVTIPTNAPHPDEAEEFVAFLLGPEGQAIMRGHSHPLLASPQTDNFDALPEGIKPFCVPLP